MALNCFRQTAEIEKIIESNSQTLAQFVQNTQFDRVIDTVYDIADGGLGNAASHIELVLRHPFFCQQFHHPSTDSLIKLQLDLTTPRSTAPPSIDPALADKAERHIIETGLLYETYNIIGGTIQYITQFLQGKHGDIFILFQPIQSTTVDPGLNECVLRYAFGLHRVP